MSSFIRSGYATATVTKLFEMANKAGAAGKTVDKELYAEAKDHYEEAFYRVVFIGAENSTGFHNPSEALRILSDVMAEGAARGIVAIGDSITDGRGTDTDHNNRWTDVLSSRLQMNDATKNVSMMNQGIGATNLVGTGTAAQARFARDVLGQSGVKYAIVLDGVNDIGGGTGTLDSIKSAYMSLITMAHAKNVLIYGGTITPFGADASYAAHDALRVQVNQFIRSGVFDGVIDFDMAVTDGGNPAKLQEMYAKWSMEDGLHPGPAGYQKMGDTPDLTLFTK